MSLTETFMLSLRNIAGSKMRTFLTMLGIIIGITAVIVIVGMGNGLENYMKDSFASLGTNTLTVMVMGRGTSRAASEEDVYKIVEDNPLYLERISPTVDLNFTVKVGTETTSASATGVSEDYFAIEGYEIARGRGLSWMDMKDRKRVCVIGAYTAETYYGGDAVGQYLRAGSLKLKIIGVMAQEASEMEKGGTDDCVYLPYTTAARASGLGNLTNYSITITDEQYASEARQVVEDGLEEIFGDDSSFLVISMAEMLDIMTSMLGVVIGILAVIAGISLVVGGIGIMNIMLVSVTERTREIGIRKALGAKESVILRQFVIEAATTSALGGVIGILLGYVFSSVATTIIDNVMDTTLAVTPSADSVLLAFGISAGIGVLFGYLPAKKAARLNPIDALRYE